MMRRNRHSKSVGGKKTAAALALMAAVCVLIKLLSTSGLEDGIKTFIQDQMSEPETVRSIISLELGGAGRWTSFTDLFNNSQDSKNEYPDYEDNLQMLQLYFTPHGAQEDIQQQEEIIDTPEQTQTPQSLPEGTLDGSGISIKNGTDYEIDVNTLLNEDLNLTVSQDQPSVLIVHTHGSESYMPDGTYEETDPYRTDDNEHNVVKVGSVLEEKLESYGINVIHDTTLHDYPAYDGAYSRAMESIEKWLVEYPSISMVIDLHRDAISDENGKQYKTVAQIGDQTCSQVLLVVGTDFSGLDHPYWQENMKFAVKLQYAMNSMYPSLAKPISISKYRYNQNATKGSLIVEVGCTGNTLEESIAAAGYFADAMASVVCP